MISRASLDALLDVVVDGTLGLMDELLGFSHELLDEISGRLDEFLSDILDEKNKLLG